MASTRGPAAHRDRGGSELGVTPPAVASDHRSQRSALWLPLLQRLTEVSPGWFVFKNAESAFSGYGDVDSSVPARERPALIGEFRAWADHNGLGPVVVCEHAPTLGVLVALSGAEPFFELDLSERKIFLGSTMFTSEQVVGRLTEMDERGFRRIRPGAEGIIKLILNGVRRDGHPATDSLRAKSIPRLLAQDPESVRQMAQLFGPAEKSALRLADSTVRGGWDRRAALEVQAWFVLCAAREPQSVVARIVFHRAMKRCPVLRAVAADRNVPGDAAEWLETVRRTHSVYDVAGGSR